MQKLLDTGKVKSIGVSNFQIRHIEQLLADPSCKIIPAVNQIEVCNWHSFVSRVSQTPANLLKASPQ